MASEYEAHLARIKRANESRIVFGTARRLGDRVTVPFGLEPAKNAGRLGQRYAIYSPDLVPVDDYDGRTGGFGDVVTVPIAAPILEATFIVPPGWAGPFRVRVNVEDRGSPAEPWGTLLDAEQEFIVPAAEAAPPGAGVAVSGTTRIYVRGKARRYRNSRTTGVVWRELEELLS